MECFIIVTVVWVFSVCLHEFGHAWVADRGGDYTVRDKGYLNMNPLHYAHPLYSLLMPVLFMIMGGIGLPGGAVYIERSLLRSRGWETGMSLAGPAMNLVIVGVIAACFNFGWVKDDPENLASASLAFILELQISAIILNLLPVPPLDGFQALAPWLPEQLRERLSAISNQALFVLVLLLWFVPAVSDTFWSLVMRIMIVLGVSPLTAFSGLTAFRFWEK